MAKKSKAVVKAKKEVKVDSPEVQEWTEPFPSEGLVRVMFKEDTGFSEVTGAVGRMGSVKKGEVRTIDAAVAHSMHRFITAAPKDA